MKCTLKRLLLLLAVLGASVPAPANTVAPTPAGVQTQLTEIARKYPIYFVDALDPVPDSQPIAPERIAAAMKDVDRILTRAGLGPVPPYVKAPAHILRVEETYASPGYILYGVYFHTRHLDDEGRMVHSEKIVIFLPPSQECAEHEVLVHELLHAMHARLRHLNPNDSELDIDSEVFVRSLYPPRVDFPSCPEEAP